MNGENVLFVDSPIGTIELREKNGFLAGLNFRKRRPGKADWVRPLLSACARQLEEYFAGRRTVFEVPLALEGTAFQLEVWGALRGIPFGRTVSYGEIARKIGRPAAARAVGAADGANPVSIIIPCHRVIGADGRLTGYGGGLERKEWLLRHEQAWAGTAGGAGPAR